MWNGNLLFSASSRSLNVEPGSRPADKNFFVLDPANHVHVDHGDSFVERPRRLLHPLRRTQKAQLFAREIRKENAALELPFRGASSRASSSTPAVPEALSSAPG